MCDFKPGDEVVCVDVGDSLDGSPCGDVLTLNAVYVVESITSYSDSYGNFGLRLVGCPPRLRPGYPLALAFYSSHRFRKVQKRNDRLTIEAFMTIKDGFEEPKRAPVRKRERAQ